ncbi:MAG: Gfo/Idh/MocA family oxidoreductase [Armatimonadota bacterium]|nr:Gfo/Idh/MocA family oxidoreductase [Armatimonadota bacterium]
MTLHIGIVGAGRVGTARAHQLKTYSDVEITAVADPNRPNRDKLAKDSGAELAVADHKRLVSDKKVDVVYIASPPNTHSQIAVDALNAGKHVICEPPIAISIGEAEEMLAAAVENNRQLLVALSERYDPVNQEVYRLIEADEIGFPFIAQVTYIEDEFNRLNNWQDWKGTWDIAGGGILMERGSGILDLLCFFFGQIEGVNAVCTRFAIEPLNKAEDTSMLSLEFKEDIGAYLLMTGAAQYSTWPPNFKGLGFRMEIFGLKGSVQVTNYPPRLAVVTKGQRRREISESEILAQLPNDMLRDFFDCILEGKEPLVTAKDALYALRVILAGYKASRNKRRVELLEEV